MTNLKTLTFILISILLFACNGQKKTDKIIEQNTTSINIDTVLNLKGIVEDIERRNTVESSHVGISGSSSEQYRRYEMLKILATVEELTTLTDHRNSAVRCYAFQALASKKAKNVFKVLLTHLHDTSSVFTQSGCCGMSNLTGDYFIAVVTPTYIEHDVYKLNQKEQQTVDSILLYDKSIILFSKARVLEKLKPLSENYDRIRELVALERNESALKALAKYQKQNDKKLIASFFGDDNSQLSALYAAREFPDDYFYPFIKKVFEQEWKKEFHDNPKWRIYYQTLAKFPRPETIELFDRTTKSKEEYKYQTLCSYLLIAITKYPNKLFDPIMTKIKLDNYKMEEVKYNLENDD